MRGVRCRISWGIDHYVEDFHKNDYKFWELFLKNNRFVKIVTDRYLYFVKFIDFKIKDDISPLDFKRNDIYNIIISRRKVRLAKKVRNDIYERALKNDEFEIYYH